MELTVLADNNTFIDRYFYGEPGVSYLIKEDNKTILFDVGYSELFIENAKKMNISLLDIDYIVLSHGHIDHTGGLVPLAKMYMESKSEEIDYKKPTVITHPLTFSPKKMDSFSDTGSIYSEDKVANHFNLKLSKEPLWLTDKLVYLGEIERKNNFEALTSRGKIKMAGEWQEDYLLDDSAIVYNTSEGLVIVTGCSHSGICNIITYAQEICNDNRIIDIIGGFHLLQPEKTQIDMTVEFLKKTQLKSLHACHCTDLQSKIALANELPLKEVGVGLRLYY